MLLSHAMNVLERILDGRMRKSVKIEIGEESSRGLESEVINTAAIFSDASTRMP